MNKEKKVYNWKVIPITTQDLLEACLEAFNELPNKRLKNNQFPNTKAIAQRLESKLEEIKEEKENLTTF